MCPVEAGGHRGPGGKAASQSRGQLSGTLPFPATESEEGTGLVSALHALPVSDKEHQTESSKHTHPSTNSLPHSADGIFLFSAGGVFLGPICTSSGLSPEPSSRAVGQGLHVSQKAAGHRDPAPQAALGVSAQPLPRPCIPNAPPPPTARSVCLIQVIWMNLNYIRNPGGLRHVVVFF